MCQWDLLEPKQTTGFWWILQERLKEILKGKKYVEEV